MAKSYLAVTENWDFCTFSKGEDANKVKFSSGVVSFSPNLIKLLYKNSSYT